MLERIIIFILLVLLGGIIFWLVITEQAMRSEYDSWKATQSHPQELVKPIPPVEYPDYRGKG